MRKIVKSLINTVEGTLISLLTIGISVIISLNFKFIYNYSIDKFNLVKIGGVSKDNLIKDFNYLINYLQNPFIKKLEFENFIMSKNGEFHFYEVKKIFLNIYLLILIIIIILLARFIYYKYKNIPMKWPSLINKGANGLIIIIAFLASVITTNFSKAFVIFHKIFFNNDYWIFDEKTDPIITVLPEELFELYAIIILSIVIVSIIIYKGVYYKNMKTKKK
ncbi:TIGR01906 family membrane protein [Clostridium sp.]|uniref:TIGR01906 family membrane protein n=1 Tax=Clostridium sp. TaxID=1506 RepID=UPI00261C7E2E|nr:TIGR01906 family membrane protein [Clostridium sp.]